jgi:hypothetical protein
MNSSSTPIVGAEPGRVERTGSVLGSIATISLLPCLAEDPTTLLWITDSPHLHYPKPAIRLRCGHPPLHAGYVVGQSRTVTKNW